MCKTNYMILLVIYNMKIISWNVNGLRAAFNKDTLKQAFNELDGDVIALQEIKCTVDQLTENQLNYKGYSMVLESARNRKGYSGVAVYVRAGINYKILHTTIGDKDFYDEEGRTIVLEFDNFFLINCYWPNGGKSPEHYDYKLKYYDKFFALAKKLEAGLGDKFGKPVIFLGDVNATNADIDLARPKENKDKLGCTEPERTRLAQFYNNFIDTYRYINGDRIQYTWWDMKTRSRERNVGWRIDYIYTSQSLKDKIKNATIEDQTMGSDHCPITLDIDL